MGAGSGARAAVLGLAGMGMQGVMTDTLEAQWTAVRARLKAELGESMFNSWVKPLGPVALADGRVSIGVPSRFMRDWVQSHFADRLAVLWRQENPAVLGIEMQVSSGTLRTPAPVVAEAPVIPRAPARPGLATPLTEPHERTFAEVRMMSEASTGHADRDIGAPLDARYTFDNFVVGKSNELAHAAARRVAESPDVKFNPLFLYGGVGLGKTHLMHAIAWSIRERNPGRRVIYLSAEKFMYQFIRALRFKDTMAFKQLFRSTDVLMIDDVQFISGKDSTQEEFFHTFNALVDHQRQVIISADRAPSDLEGIEARITSRLGCGLVADIHPTDYELRLGILQSKLDQSGGNRDVPPRVLEFLAHRITSNVRELEGAMNRVLAYADLVGRPITLEMMQEVLQDLLRANDRRVTIEDIQRRTAEYFNIRLADMLSARRARAVARPRQVAMYLAKQLTSRSLPEIGRKFGGRDHTTVIHAVRKIEELREQDASLSDDVDMLRRMLEG